MATSAERTKGLRERERRGLRRFTVPVSDRVMAKHGYEGAVTTGHDQQAQAESPDSMAQLSTDKPGEHSATQSRG
jgi:hypothetical protein